jgi:predicted N-acetyltransferase YhbS
MKSRKRSIGSLLVEVGLERRREDGYIWAAVLEHSKYYPRFGFVPAIRYGLDCECLALTVTDLLFLRDLRAD